MSTARRAYDLMRGYINHEYDRLKEMDLWDAWRELDSPVDPAKRPPSIEPEGPAGEQQAPQQDQIDLARRILGVSETATFDEIRKAYERQNKRSDPSRFPEGSQERARAAILHRQINIAYQKLTESVPTTEKRFRSLEIE